MDSRMVGIFRYQALRPPCVGVCPVFAPLLGFFWVICSGKHR